MAYVAGNLGLLSHANGFNNYRYDIVEDLNLVGDSGYFNNKDDNLNLQVGDTIFAFQWATIVGTQGQDGAGGTNGTLVAIKMLAVTHAVANDAALNAGEVSVAEVLISTAGALSSG